MTAVVDTVVCQLDSLSGLSHSFPHPPDVFTTDGSQMSVSGMALRWGKLLYSKLSSRSMMGVVTGALALFPQ